MNDGYLHKQMLAGRGRIQNYCRNTVHFFLNYRRSVDLFDEITFFCLRGVAEIPIRPTTNSKRMCI